MMLKPGCRKECIDCQKAMVRIAVLPIMDVQTRWNSTIELLGPAYRVREFTPGWLKNPKYCDYRWLFTRHHEWTIINYIMKVLRPFQYWTLWMSKWHMVTLRHVITLFNDMFNHMDGIMRALVKKKNQRKEDVYFPISVSNGSVFGPFQL